MLHQSAREHRTMMDTTHDENKRFLKERRVAHEQEQRGTETKCSLFREATGALRDMSRAMLQCQSFKGGTTTATPEMDPNDGEEPFTLQTRHAGGDFVYGHSGRAVGL